MQDAIIVQRPVSTGVNAAELVLLFHGVGSNAKDLLPLGQTLAQHRPDAWIVSVQSPDRFGPGSGSGWQWFSVQDVTEENRPARVQAAMPAFLETIRSWQKESGVAAADTTLIGFSQGAIMALEATQQDTQIARRIIAIAGRFAQPPRVAPVNTVFYLMHGEQDRVMPVRLSVDAERALRALGVQATLDLFPGLGHGIDARVVASIVQRLSQPASEGSQ